MCVCMSYVRMFTYLKRFFFRFKDARFDATAGEGSSIQDGGRHSVQPLYDSVGEVVMNHQCLIVSLM